MIVGNNTPNAAEKLLLATGRLALERNRWPHSNPDHLRQMILETIWDSQSSFIHKPT